jgi:hypothetical protein
LWLFRRSGEALREALADLRRFVGTTRTAKHRVFQFLDRGLVAESKIVVIASEDAFVLGVVSSRIHIIFSTIAGGWLGVGNDPTYNHLDCFNKFPFPVSDEGTKDRIRKIAEELDVHRKRVQAQNPGLTLTDMYNVLEKLRMNEPLNEKEQRIHNQGLVSVLRQLHDDLDAALFAAYGWPTTLTDAEILERLVALNAERAKEEASGLIRWLRPEYQNPGGTQAQQTSLAVDTDEEKADAKSAKNNGKLPWPKTLSERVKAVTKFLSKTTGPVTADDVAAQFFNARRAAVTEILETLCTMGHAHRGKLNGTYLP